MDNSLGTRDWYAIGVVVGDFGDIPLQCKIENDKVAESYCKRRMRRAERDLRKFNDRHCVLWYASDLNEVYAYPIIVRGQSAEFSGLRRAVLTEWGDQDET